MIKNLFKYLFLILAFSSCIEEVSLQSLDFDTVIIIEARLTDEFKKHQVKIFNSYKLDQNQPVAESNALVFIEDSNNNKYNFTEAEPGIYISDIEFKAERNIDYQIFIKTSDNTSYQSSTEKLTSTSTIEEVLAYREIDDADKDNIIIAINSYDPNNESKYYRYEYEETYRIIPPFYSGRKAAYSLTPSLTFYTIPKTKQEQNSVCYNTVVSNKVIQTTTTDLLEDRVVNFPIRTINRSNFIISNRYSILVKQYTQTFNAYVFFKILDELASSENLFSSNQPGFLEGNILAETNTNKRIFGYFEVNSVSSKRVFFNYRDFYETGNPPYPLSCYLIAPAESKPGGGSPLADAIDLGTLIFYDYNVSPQIGEGPFLMVVTGCGDCTEFGVKEKPDFWVD